MTNRSQLELAVGVFMFIGLMILVFFVFFIRDFQIVKPGYKFDVIFEFANGLKESAPARLAGVEAGEVKSIKIFYEPQTLKTKVRVKVWLKKGALVPSDSQVWINTLGLLGEKYIEIIPGSNYNSLVKDGDTIKGDDPVAIQEITEEMKKLVLKLESAFDGLAIVVEKINKGEGTIGKLIYDEALYSNVERLSHNLNGLNKTFEQINSGQGSIGKLIYDETIYKNISEMTDDLRLHPWKLFWKGKEKAQKK